MYLLQGRLVLIEELLASALLLVPVLPQDHQLSEAILQLRVLALDRGILQLELLFHFRLLRGVLLQFLIRLLLRFFELANVGLQSLKAFSELAEVRVEVLQVRLLLIDDAVQGLHCIQDWL